MDISGTTAVVTGAGSGLGAATAKLLSGAGARVAVFDLDGEKAESVAKEVDGLAVACDVAQEDSVSSGIARVISEFGPPRIAVNCAGVGLAARIVGKEGVLSTELFRKTIEVNLIGTYLVMSHAAKAMMTLDPIAAERGVIINTASVAWQDGQLGQSAYAASKGAIASMCLPAAREFAQSRIRVMAIAPGLFETPMMQGLPEEVTEKIVANIPNPARLGRPEEYALMVQQIIENRYLNGTTIRLDGAVRLPPR